jgi:enoyl-[acyl-carrier-protein] reductase (NADH)
MTTKLLEGKKALITGSRRGIGAGIAKFFAEHGADVGIKFSMTTLGTQRLHSPRQSRETKPTPINVTHHPVELPEF